MNVLVVGAGSIGKRHIKNIIENFPDVNVRVMDLVYSNIKEIQNKFNVEGYLSFSKAMEGVDAVLICTPPDSHLEYIVDSMSYGIKNIFVEKPLANNLSLVEAILTRAKRLNVILQVGYMFRFESGINKIKELLDSGDLGKPLIVQAEYGQHLEDWRSWQDYRKSYTAMKTGIILDSSHEIDYLRYLLGEIIDVSAFAKKNLNVQMEDSVVAILNFESGVIGTLKLDMVRKQYSRTCEIICEKGVVNWNFMGYKEDRVPVVKVYYSEHPNKDFLPGIDVFWFYTQGRTINSMYIDELKHFFDCIEHNEKPLVDGWEGFKTLKTSLLIRESIERMEVVEA